MRYRRTLSTMYPCADSLEEGERLAILIGDKVVVFMRNHGVLVAVDSIARGYSMLYMLEQVCCTQIRVMSTGEKLLRISLQVIDPVQTPDEHDRHKGQYIPRGDEASARS